MEIDSLRQEIQKRDALLKTQEKYQKKQQAHAERLHAQQMAAIQAMYQAQGMTFVMPKVALALVLPQWRMFAQMSFSPAPQGSGVQGSNPYQTPQPSSEQHGDQGSGVQGSNPYQTPQPASEQYGDQQSGQTSIHHSATLSTISSPPEKIKEF
ncbi:hypothetical protein U9M48_043507 [Paspalum notatum var. saurae]|uniref:Uncharacterized protein n=1 Tax=Paspalum notatum var. saurae TaxID=547442 RepID=A0AAQ3UXC0_PASNO